MKRTDVVKTVLRWYVFMALVGFMVSIFVFGWQDVKAGIRAVDFKRISAENGFWETLDQSATLDESQWTPDMVMANEFYTDVIVGLVADDPDQTIRETKSALNRLAGNAPREYSSEFVSSTSLGHGNEHLTMRNSNVDKFRQYRESGSTGLVQDVPPLLSDPEFIPVTGWRWMFSDSWVWDVGVVLVVWTMSALLTLIVFMVDRFTDVFSVFAELNRPGERLTRFVLVLMLLPVLLILGAVHLSLRAGRIMRGAIKAVMRNVSDSYRLIRHPNREEIRRARRAIQALKTGGAQVEEIRAAEELLRGLLIFNPTDMRPPRPSRTQRLRAQRLVTAREDLERLRIEQELERSDAQAGGHKADEMPDDQNQRRKVARSRTSEGT